MESRRRAARDNRDRSDQLQLLQFGQYVLPITLVLLRLDRCRKVGIKLQNVVAQFRRRPVKFPFSQLSQQLCVAVVRELFRCIGRFATVQITVEKHQGVGAHLFEESPVFVDGCIDALDIQIFGLNANPLKGTDFRHVSQGG